MPEKKTKGKRIIPIREIGKPIDQKQLRPSQILFQQVKEELESQNYLDSQKSYSGIAEGENFGYPNKNVADSQNEKIGYPNSVDLDSLIAKDSKRLSKENADLDSLIAKDENLDSQKTEKTKTKGKWQKYDRSRNRKGIFLRTDDELTTVFKKFCLDHKLDFSQGTELAWQQFMESLDSQKNKHLDSLIAVNNIISSLSKTKTLIIKLYLAYNSIFNSESKWKTSDDKVGLKFNNADIRLIEVGIIQTHGELYQRLDTGKFVKKDPTKIINAFSYYKQKIETNIEYFEGNEQMTAYLLESSRMKWKEWTGKSLDLNFLNEK